jgi:hypothetical protein
LITIVFQESFNIPVFGLATGTLQRRQFHTRALDCARVRFFAAPAVESSSRRQQQLSFGSPVSAFLTQSMITKELLLAERDSFKNTKPGLDLAGSLLSFRT